MRPRPRSPRLAIALVVMLALPTAVGVVTASAVEPRSSSPPSTIRFVSSPPPRGFHPPASSPRPDPSRIARQAARVERWTHVLVHVPHALAAFAQPRRDSRQVGLVPAGSKYYGFPIVAWVEETASDGRWGRVELPYTWPRREGWIRLAGLRRETTGIRVEVDLSEHLVTVRKLGRILFRAPGATGASASPTPVGEYFVTDRVAFSAGGYLGSFAFGISGIQPRLPPGWNGGDQLAIHGTNQPASIGTSASAGCVRVSEGTLDRLMPILRYGTPVVVRA